MQFFDSCHKLSLTHSRSTPEQREDGRTQRWWIMPEGEIYIYCLAVHKNTHMHEWNMSRMNSHSVKLVCAAYCMSWSSIFHLFFLPSLSQTNPPCPVQSLIMITVGLWCSWKREVRLVTWPDTQTFLKPRRGSLLDTVWSEMTHPS